MLIESMEELKRVISENNEKGGNEEITLTPYGEYKFDGEPIVITSPITIDGQYAHFDCANKTVFIIASSKTKISAIKFEHVLTAVAIDGMGRKISDIEVSHIESKAVLGKAISIASTKSNSVISDVRILHNVFIGKEGMEVETMEGFTVPISVNCCFANTTEAVDNCIAENILIAHNVNKGGHRLGINLCTSSCNYMLGPDKCGSRANPILRNVKVIDNDLDGGWDSTINIIGGTCRQKNGLFENCEIAYNRVSYGVWGIGGVAMEPVFGEMSDAKLVNFDVHHNVCVRQAIEAGEMQHAIAFCSGRIDFYHNTKCARASLDGLKIHHNEIYETDRGIFVSATDSVIDGANSEMDSCYVSDVMIYENKLFGVSEAFIVAGSYLEGRLTDWNIGYPRHNKVWSELFKTNDVETCISHDNYVDKVVIKDNYVKGNRYMYRLYACFAHGHAVMKNNRLSIDEISGNVFEEYEGHCDIKKMFIDDWVKDDGGNEFDESWKMRI